MTLNFDFGGGGYEPWGGGSGSKNWEETKFTGGAVDENKHKPSHRPEMDPEGPGLRVILKRSRQHTARHLLKNPFVFQCPPMDSFTWTQDYNWSEYETIRKGTFSRPQSKGLRQVSFETLFIDWDATWTLVKQKPRWKPNPLEMADELRRIMNSGTPFHLEVRQPALWQRSDLEMMASLRSMSVTENHGELDARYLDLSFVEYREAEIDRQRFGPKFPLQHKIQEGDTLKKLSKKYYHGYSGWRHIKKANHDKLNDKGVGPSDDLSLVRYHQKPLNSLTIPPKPEFMKSDDPRAQVGEGAGGGGTGTGIG